MTVVKAMGLVEDPLFLSFIVHLEDALLPLRVSAWDPNSNVGNHLAVVVGDSPSYGSDKRTSVGLVSELVGELRLSFKLSEVEMGQITAHLDVAHAFFMD